MQNLTRAEFLREKRTVKGGVNIGPLKNQTHQSVIIWIDPNEEDPEDPWKDLVWGDNDAQEFANALIEYFTHEDTPDRVR